MGQALKKNDRGYTYQDYLGWPDEERWEIINGVAYDMSPAPSIKHQDISSNLHVCLGGRAKEKGCRVYAAPTDVVFDNVNVVQPDIFVICDKSKITEKNIQGAPDFIVEILSPATSVKDRREKRHLYENFGVKDYMLFFPTDESVEWLTLKDGKYGEPQVFGWDETMTIEALGVTLNLWEIFDKPKPGAEEMGEEAP